MFSVPLGGTLTLAALMASILIAYGFSDDKTPSERGSGTSPFKAEQDYLAAQANMADNITDAVAIIDQRERVIYANPAAQKLLQITNLGRPLSTYIREPTVRAVVQDALKGDKTDAVIYHVENPTDSYIRVTASPFTPDVFDPPRPMALLFFYDVTEYNLVDSQRADFLANASHELKTPVASLLGYIETLQGHAKDDPEAREKFLGIMQSQAERMQRLINDLLSLRRIEQVEHIAPNETADLHLAAKAAIEAEEIYADKRRIKMKLKSKKKCLVVGHQDELIQLALNLLDNALKISADGTRITLSIDYTEKWTPGQAFTGSSFSGLASTRRIVPVSTPERPHYIMTIRDQGPGFSREHIPRIGERFYRIAGDLSSQDKGTGLGLAIVKHITRRHRGGLLIQSARGEGTEFTVILPSAPQ
ncbi:ATP-binding protein [Hellea balneolensis]|uniref:ATP-binding protein n=1 Tax=Hellea balneolensis TaxID=287478 RepID=UPI000402B0D9|nr:ATP-binding protein [Hellea balneolensis]